MDAAKRHDLDVRNKRRRDNYAFAKSLGFTGKEAKLICKWSQKRIAKRAGQRTSCNGW